MVLQHVLAQYPSREALLLVLVACYAQRVNTRARVELQVALNAPLICIARVLALTNALHVLLTSIRRRLEPHNVLLTVKRVCIMMVLALVHLAQ